MLLLKGGGKLSTKLENTLKNNYVFINYIELIQDKIPTYTYPQQT